MLQLLQGNITVIYINDNSTVNDIKYDEMGEVS